MDGKVPLSADFELILAQHSVKYSECTFLTTNKDCGSTVEGEAMRNEYLKQ